MPSLIVTIGGLYMALGAAMTALCVLRARRRMWTQALVSLIWATLLWRIGLRWFHLSEDIDVGMLGRWATNEWVIVVQLWALLVAVMFSLVNEWIAFHGGRR